jgi:glutamate-1-semialdehyde aminotransferase
VIKPPSSIKNFAASDALLERALKTIPSGTQTFSKGHSQYPVGASPLFLERGEGAYVWDVDGNQYIDYPLALGPNILGYGNKAVNAAAAAQISLGLQFSLPTRLEVEVAEMLVERIPCAEMVRFGKNGSDVTSAAVRVARAATGRERVACCGYHGWQDWYIGTTTRDGGVPKAVKELTHSFEYNKLETLSALFDRYPGQIAAVILEPIGVVDPLPGFLEDVANLTRKNGAVLIYDEVVTGFRLARGGAQELYGVTPDLACFGKAMANGFPISTVVGKSDLMKVFDDIFFSFTAGGEAMSLAAAKATMLEIDRLDVYPKLWRLGDGLRDAFNALIKKHGLEEWISCIGPGPHTVISIKEKDGIDPLAIRSLFQQEVIARGILFLVGHNICAALSEDDVRRTLAAYDEALAQVRRGIEGGSPEKLLRGRKVKAVFRKP